MNIQEILDELDPAEKARLQADWLYVLEKELPTMPPEKRLAGLLPEQRLAGLTLEQRLAGLSLSPEEIEEIIRVAKDKLKKAKPADN